jgi:hypothetical protein
LVLARRSRNSPEALRLSLVADRKIGDGLDALGKDAFYRFLGPVE